MKVTAPRGAHCVRHMKIHHSMASSTVNQDGLDLCSKCSREVKQMQEDERPCSDCNQVNVPAEGQIPCLTCGRFKEPVGGFNGVPRSLPQPVTLHADLACPRCPTKRRDHSGPCTPLAVPASSSIGMLRDIKQRVEGTCRKAPDCHNQDGHRGRCAGFSPTKASREIIGGDEARMEATPAQAELQAYDLEHIELLFPEEKPLKTEPKADRTTEHRSSSRSGYVTPLQFARIRIEDVPPEQVMERKGRIELMWEELEKAAHQGEAIIVRNSSRQNALRTVSSLRRKAGKVGREIVTRVPPATSDLYAYLKSRPNLK